MVFFLFFFNAKCQVRKLVMGFMGWTEMPTTGSQTVPVVELNVLQQRLLPESLVLDDDCRRFAPALRHRD